VGVPAEQLLVKQSSQIMKVNGMSAAEIDANAAAVHRMCAIARSNADAKTQEAQLQAVADSLTAKLTAIDASKAEAVKQETTRSLQMVSSPWFHYLITIKPAETLRKVRVPVLAVNGTLDLQVDAKDNLPAIEKALKDGGNKDVTVQELPGLNHLFQTATTGSPGEYSTIEETMSPVALKVISDWIVARTMPAKK
jgi:hypothetical protein